MIKYDQVKLSFFWEVPKMVLSSSIYLAFFHARYTSSDDRHRHHLLVKFEDASDLAPDAMDAMETQKITRRFVSIFMVDIRS